MKKIPQFLFCFFFFIAMYGQVPNITYNTHNVYTVNQPIQNLVPVNSGGNIPNQAFVTTLAGSGASGYVDGGALGATFNLPTVVVVDNQNNIIVVDRSNHKIRKITQNGVVTTLAGTGEIGAQDGPGNTATFNYPDGAVVDSQGNIFISDQSNHKIRKITPNGEVSTFAGSGVAGFANGSGLTAKFKYPAGMCIDDNDNLYIADFSNNRIRKITPTGIVTTIAGISAGNVDGTVTTAKFNGPTGVCLDTFGNIYVADYGNQKIRKIDLSGNVTTYAGNSIAGSVDGYGTAASFYHPAIVVCDKANNLFVTDQGNHKIRKITSSGEVSTYAGSGILGSTDDKADVATFNSPTGIAIGQLNTLFIADYGNNKIRKIKKYGYSITPNLPLGLVIDATTGVISGTPSQTSPLTSYTVSVENQFGSNTFNLFIEVQGTLGVTSFDTNNLKMYPNPVQENFTISSEGNDSIKALTIFNLLGQEVKSVKNIQFGRLVDVSSLQSGNYICQIETDEGSKQIKFIKQ